MSARRMITHLREVLLADPDIQAMARDRLGRELTVIEGTPDLSTIGAHELPALILEVDDGTSAPSARGIADADTSAIVVLVWDEQRRDRGFWLRVDLPDIFTRAIMRNPTLTVDGEHGVDAAWLSGWETDRGQRHPRHGWGCRISVQFETVEDI